MSVIPPSQTIDLLPQDHLPDLRDQLKIFERYKWGIASITVVVTLLSLVTALAMTPIFRATTTVLIEAESNRPVRQVEEVYDPGTERVEYYKTQSEILKSRELAKRVVERLDLVDNAEFADDEGSLRAKLDWRTWLPFLSDGAELTSLTDDELRERKKNTVIDAFIEQLSIESVPNTQLVKIHFDAKNRKLAAQSANALAEVYIESALDGRLSMTQKASSWLTQKLGDMRDQMQTSEQALQAFREQEQLVNVGGERGFVEEELTDNATRLREARKKRAELENAYQRVHRAGNEAVQLEDVSALMQDDVVRRAKESVLEASEEVKKLEQRYGPKHPKMIATRARLDEANAAYHRQLIIGSKGVQVEYEIALQNERALSQFEASARGTIRGLDRKQFQLKTLERDVESNRQLYDMFLTRFKETDVAGGYESATARVIDAAIPPDTTFKPRKRLIVLTGFVSGLFLGLLLAAVLAFTSDIIKTSEELEVATGLGILGVLPLVSGMGSAKQLPTMFVKEPKSAFSEGIRSIQAGVVLSDLDHKKKRLLVTSSTPEEGKTTLAINLAISLGQIEKVLLMDADLRRPAVGKKCGLPQNAQGLCEVLSSGAKLADCIYRLPECNIDVLPVGRVPPNPTEVLTSDRFKTLMESLSEQYDRIVIDSAPCHAVSDTYLLSRHADRVIFVVKANTTTRRAVSRAIQHLRQAQVPLLGSVISQVDLKRYGHDYGSYYYDYGYYA